MDVRKKNVQNTANDHETSKSEKANEEKDKGCIFFQETFLNSTSGEKWVRCMSCLKWAHEECARVDPVINYDFCSL
jgi:hypothetical protein